MQLQYRQIEDREAELEERIEVLEDVVKKLVEEVAPGRLTDTSRRLSKSVILQNKLTMKAKQTDSLEDIFSKVKFKDPYIYAGTTWR
jgi:hypothetical protein